VCPFSRFLDPELLRRASTASKSTIACCITADLPSWQARHAPTRRTRRCSATVKGRASSRVETIALPGCRNPIHASAGSPSWGERVSFGAKRQRPLALSKRSAPRPK
jgi:hypothetical protein